MEQKNYIALVLREATALVNEAGKQFATALKMAEGDAQKSQEINAAIEARILGALTEVDYLEDILKFSSLKEIPRELWRGGDCWTDVLTGAAMAALVHDVRKKANDIIHGRTPRLDNIQIQ